MLIQTNIFKHGSAEELERIYGLDKENIKKDIEESITLVNL